jgi:S1-C subfamily serine protease
VKPTTQHLLRLLRIAICAGVTATATVSASASPDSGVVAVYAQLGGRWGQGSGFLVSPSGEVITAYHVIYGAQRIDVSWRGVLFKDVLIVRIRPDRDLAVLRIVNPPRPANMQPLRLAEQGSSWSAGQSVHVLGHARGLPLQRYDGTVTQEGVLLSEQLRNDQGEKLFREDGIRLVPADVTIYSGLSGGPILLGNEVIGVLSGSLSVGRGISWGIPVEYLRSMQEIGRRAGEMGQ